MKIAILTPTRSRPEKLYRFIRSVINTASGENTIFLYISIDRNDPDKSNYITAYRKIVADQCANDALHIFTDNNNFIILNTGDQKPVGIIWNDLQELAEKMYSPDYYIMGNDDLVYRTKDWDQILVGNLESLPHKYFVSWFNDEINGQSHCAFPIVSDQWIQQVGYFTPTIFEFLCNDTWVFDIAKRINCLNYIPEVVASHLHFTQGKSEYDQTYRQWRDNGATGRDLKLFNETGDLRQEKADELNKIIKAL